MIYLINILFISIAALVSDYKKNNIFLFYILVFFLTLLPSLRSINVGTDTYNYWLLFESIKNTKDLSYYNGDFERGYILLNYIYILFFENFNGFLFLFYFILFYFICDFFKKNSNSILLSLMVFLCFGLYFSSFNIMRQVLALAICLFSIKYLFENKIYRFLLIIFAATLFHKTAFLFFLVYFAFKIKKNFYLILSFFILVLFVVFKFYFSFVEFFFDKASSYSEFGEGAGGREFLVLYSIIFIYFYFISRIIKNLFFDFYLKVFSICIGLIFIFYLLQAPLNGPMRLVIYFSWSLCLLFPMSLNIFKVNIQRIWLGMIYLSLLVIYFLYSLNNGLIPEYYFFGV